MSQRNSRPVVQAVLVVVVASIVASTLHGCSDAVKHLPESYRWAGCTPLMCAVGELDNNTHDFAYQIVQGAAAGATGAACEDTTSGACKSYLANTTSTLMINLIESALGVQWANAFANVTTFVTDTATPVAKAQSCEFDVIAAFVAANNINITELNKAIEMKKSVDDKLNSFISHVETAKPHADNIISTWNMIEPKAKQLVHAAVNEAMKQVPQSFFVKLGEKKDEAASKLTDELNKLMQTYLTDPMVIHLSKGCRVETQDSCAEKKDAVTASTPSWFKLPTIELPELKDVQYEGIDFSHMLNSFFQTCIKPGRLIMGAVLGTSCPSAWEIWKDTEPLLSKLVVKVREHDDEFINYFDELAPNFAVELKDKFLDTKKEILACRQPSTSLATLPYTDVSVVVMALSALVVMGVGMGMKAALRIDRKFARLPLLADETN